MATQVQCYRPIKGRVMRITAVDRCGVPLCGDDEGQGQIVATGFTQIQQQAQYNTGEEHITRTADAELCVNEKDPDALTRLQLTIDFCVVHPGIVANTVAPSRLLTNNANTGTGFALAEGIGSTRFSLEVWQRVTGPGACDPEGQQLYVYNAWPHLRNGRIGDYQIATTPSTLQVIAESTAASELWWLGEDWLGDGAVSIDDHWFQNVSSTAPPTAPDDCVIADVTCPGS